MSEASPQRQLDEVSRVIGGVEAAVKQLDRYIHDFRHDENNRQQVQQHFQENLVSQVEKLRQEIQADRLRDRADAAAMRLADRAEIEGIKREIDTIKSLNQRREGMWGAVDWILKSPLIGWLVAVSAAIWAVATGRIHP